MFMEKIDKSFLKKCMLCIAFDQGIKVLIYKFGMTSEFDVLSTVIGFAPQFNRKLSVLGHHSAVFANEIFLCFFNVFALYVYISGYAFYKEKKHCDYSVTAMVIVIMGISGAICSLIDKVIWNGSLDYIRIKNFYTFDLKDCYITISQILFILCGIKHRKEISLSEYWIYLKKTLFK